MNRDPQKPPNSLPHLPLFLRPVSEGTILHIRVQPGAKKTTWAGVQGQELKLKVQAPPVEGAANQRCLSFLARWFGIKQSDVALLKGGKSRSKVFLLEGLTLEKCLSLIPAHSPDQSNSS